MQETLIKKDFSNWLVASDIDGTLYSKTKKLPQNNFEAITRFVKDLNGHFTLASGRSPQSMKKRYESLPIILGTPTVVLNGAGIYDFINEKMVHFTPVGHEGMYVADALHKRFKSVEILVFTGEHYYIYNGGFFALGFLSSHNFKHTFCKKLSDLPSPDTWGKVIFAGAPFVINKIKKFTDAMGLHDVGFVSSSVSTYEMLHKGVDKGTAILKLAEILGVAPEHTAAIGDYYNDKRMLETVAVSAACAQAPEDLKQLVTYRACHCNKGAVADFLTFIEKTY